MGYNIYNLFFAIVPKKLFFFSLPFLLLYFVNPEYFQIVKLFYYFIFAFVIFRLSIIGHELAHLFMAKMTNAKILGIEFGNINDLIIYEKNISNFKLKIYNHINSGSVHVSLDNPNLNKYKRILIFSAGFIFNAILIFIGFIIFIQNGILGYLIMFPNIILFLSTFIPFKYNYNGISGDNDMLSIINLILNKNKIIHISEIEEQRNYLIYNDKYESLREINQKILQQKPNDYYSHFIDFYLDVRNNSSNDCQNKIDYLLNNLEENRQYKQYVNNNISYYYSLNENYELADLYSKDVNKLTKSINFISTRSVCLAFNEQWSEICTILNNRVSKTITHHTNLLNSLVFGIALMKLGNEKRGKKYIDFAVKHKKSMFASDDFIFKKLLQKID